MISATDTNILLDLLQPQGPRVEEAERTLDEARRAGALIVCEAVYAEVAAHFGRLTEADLFFGSTGIRLLSSDPPVMHRAALAWRFYSRRRPAGLVCPACGDEQAVACRACARPIRTRQHISADSLIGAYALIHADRLLSRDRGFYRRYFPELRLGLE